MIHSDFIQTLSSCLGKNAVLTGEKAVPYCTDWRARYSGNALAVVVPANTQQVADVVQLCVANRIAIVPQGGNTGLCGGSVPLSHGEQVVLSLSRMNRILEIDPANYTMTVEAGCTLASVHEAAELQDRLFPLGLTAIAIHCEIGGNISTNAGGMAVLRYGSMRDLVLGLEVVMPDGRVWNGLRSLRKDNTGYDLKQLFIGAEGTLGIITSAVLKLFPRPRSEASACIAVRDPAAANELLSHLRTSCGDRVGAFEIISRTCLELVFQHIPGTREPFKAKHEWIVITKLADALPSPLDTVLRQALESFGNGIIGFEVSADREHAEHWWKLRKSISESQKAEGISIKHDVSVPVSRVAEFIARADEALRKSYPGVRIVAFGHMGDGNIHYNISMPDAAQNRTFIAQHEHDVNRIVYDVVAKLDGSISAEHGLGQLKRDEIIRYKSAIELELMRNIKHTLDPHGMMNPGKVL